MNIKFIFKILLLIIPFIIILCFLFYKNKDIIFFSKDETINFFKSDPDYYIRYMTPLDLYARKVKTSDEYINNICKSALDFTENDIKILKISTQKADKFLNNYKYKSLYCKQIAKFPWKLALTNDRNYEEGFPHTRKDIIFISNNLLNQENLTSVLIHEKVHIYQRYNSENMEKIIQEMGYEKTDLPRPYNMRANPDINNIIYRNKNNILTFKYKSDTPNGINDINSNEINMEHPYEIMAYDIANMYKKEEFKEMFSNIR